MDPSSTHTTLVVLGVATGLSAGCATSHDLDADPPRALRSVGSFVLDGEVGWPSHLAATRNGFIVITGQEIPDGIVPMRSHVIAEDGTLSEREIDLRCDGVWSLQGGETSVVLCPSVDVRPGMRFVAIADIGADGAPLEPVNRISVAERVAMAVADGSRLWVADLSADHAGTVTLASYDRASGTRGTLDHLEYDYRVASPVLKSGGSSAWLAVMNPDPEGDIVTVHRLADGLSHPWRLCESTARVSFDFVESSDSKVATVETCGDEVRISVRDVATGDMQSVVQPGHPGGAAEAPRITRWGELLVIAYVDAGGAEVVALDRELQVYARTTLGAEHLAEIAAAGDTVAIFDGSFPRPEVTLLRLAE